MTETAVKKIVTIGVYGYTAETFFAALQTVRADVVVDIRWRRGVRGAEYAFANSRRLQAQLAALGIGYLHRRDLAPPPDVRATQAAADTAAGIARRKREQLSPAFVQAFEREVLRSFDPASLQQMLSADVKTIVLLCVERSPTACHRALVAAALAERWGIDVEHCVP